jgi:hypothetical protein
MGGAARKAQFRRSTRIATVLECSAKSSRQPEGEARRLEMAGFPSIMPPTGPAFPVIHALAIGRLSPWAEQFLYDSPAGFPLCSTPVPMSLRRRPECLLYSPSKVRS